MRALAALLLSIVIPLAAGGPGPLAAAASDDTEVEVAAQTFGRALLAGDASRLKAILPARGKVRMRVNCLGGPEDGFFSSGQIEALLEDFFRKGAVGSFEIERIESDRTQVALVHARASAVDRQGRAHDLHLHLAFQPEERRWVLREVRETSP